MSPAFTGGFLISGPPRESHPGATDRGECWWHAGEKQHELEWAVKRMGGGETYAATPILSLISAVHYKVIEKWCRNWRKKIGDIFSGRIDPVCMHMYVIQRNTGWSSWQGLQGSHAQMRGWFQKPQKFVPPNKRGGDSACKVLAGGLPRRGKHGEWMLLFSVVGEAGFLLGARRRLGPEWQAVPCDALICRDTAALRVPSGQEPLSCCLSILPGRRSRCLST